MDEFFFGLLCPRHSIWSRLIVLILYWNPVKIYKTILGCRHFTTKKHPTDITTFKVCLGSLLIITAYFSDSTCSRHRNDKISVLSTCVGVIWLMSSDASAFNKVVFPALSKPRSSILNSLSGVDFNFRNRDSKP